MSSASVPSSRKDMQEKKVADLMQEIESIRALNSSLRAYLEHIRLFKMNLAAMNENCKTLSKVNHEWVDVLNLMK